MGKWTDIEVGFVIYDREGNPITFERYVELLGSPENWRDYRRVAFDTYGDFDVSTIWLGIDHGFGMSKNPIIFETMIFARTSDDDHTSVACWRWTDEKRALRGHQAALKSLATPHVLEETLEDITEEDKADE